MFNIFKRKINKKTSNTEKKTLTHNAKKCIYFNEEQDKWETENKSIFYENYNFYNSNCCPNCGVILEKEIKNSIKCPYCKKQIIIKTNYITKERLLLCSKDLKEYEINEKQRKEINFCDNLIKNVSYIKKDINKDLDNYKRTYQNLSVRDYTWKILNDLFNNKTNEALLKFNNAMKMSYSDKMLEIFNVVRQFELANLVFTNMVLLVEFEEKDNVLATMLPHAIHLGISTKCLYGIPEIDMKVDEDSLCQLNCSKILYNFLKRNNMSIDDFKPIYLQYAKNLIIPTITPNEAWVYVKKGYEVFKNHTERNKN